MGLDISDKMVKHGMEHIQNEGLNNAILYTCNFQTLDIDKSGYTHAFDLVFSSMTPAIHNMDGLIKSMEMSRAWCCNITHLDRRNSLGTDLTGSIWQTNSTPMEWAMVFLSFQYIISAWI